jgi:hypothetical protein
MRAEGIHAHGYQDRSCSMAVQLAHQLLKNPPDLLSEAAVAAAAAAAANLGGSGGGGGGATQANAATVTSSGQAVGGAKPKVMHRSYI